MKKIFVILALMTFVTVIEAHKVTPTTHGRLLLKYTLQPNEIISFSGSYSHDNDSQNGGYTPRWEWMFDYQGNFNYDSGITSSTTTHVYTKPGNYTVAVRYKDNDGQYGAIYTFNITIVGTERYYYVKDHLGSIRQTIKEDGEIVSAQDYYAYGEIIPGRSYNNASPNEKYKFTEKERDVETNYDYFGARYYNSKLGVWNGVDPLADKYPGVSPYVYANCNPLLNIDPNGLEWYSVSEEYEEEETYTDENGEEKTRTVTKTRKVWKWYEDTPEKEIWTGNYDDNGNKITELVAGKTDTELYFNLLLENTSEQFGISDIIALGAILSGQNFLSTSGKFAGATKGTSLASKYLSKIPGKFPMRVPSITGYPKMLGGKGIRLMLTKSIGRFAGRAIPFLGWAKLAHDVGAVLYNTQTQFNSTLRTR